MARLKVKRHDQDFFEIPLESGRSYTLGRKETCDVVLEPDAGISRHHMTVSQQEDGHWFVEIHSQHIPLIHQGKSQNNLVCSEPITQFLVNPYSFELILEEAAAADDIAPSEEIYAEPPMIPEAPPEDPYAAAVTPMDTPDHMMESAGPLMAPTGNTPSQTEEEISFVGSEEKTSEIQVHREPYLKFMFSTHSESIRLKGNKWVGGRDSIAQIHLDDKKASRMHFSIEKVGEQFFIKDLKSANGTLLNGQELRANELQEVKSGDIITINQLTIIFELRDLSFSDKLKDLPLQAYNGPMILTSQEWDVDAAANVPPPQLRMPLSADQLAQLPGTVEKITPPKNKMRPLLIAVVVAIFAVGYFMDNGAQRAPSTAGKDPAVKTYESLSPDDQRLVRDSYSLAQNLYQEGKIQSAINEITRIHKIVSYYKESREMEVRLMEAQEILRQKEFIAQQRQEQEKTRLRVQQITADCREKYSNAVDVLEVKLCLSEALQLDPDNIEAQTLISSVETRLTEAQEAERKLAEFNANVDRGRDLYYKAKNLLKNKDYQEAIGAFSVHINSSFPDPDHLKDQSQRELASIEQTISNRKGYHMREARSLLEAGKYREAILMAEQAKQVDPFDFKVANFIEKSRQDLEGQMRNLYTDSVIEERFGNLELSKSKWKEIINRDIPSGTYYLKAKRKLQQYGL